MTSRKIIDIANNLDFVYDYNVTGITGNNSRITTTSYGEFLLYSTRASTNSSTGSVVLYNGGLSINNTSDVTSITSGGALTIAGGASIKKNLYIGGPGLKIPVGTTAERPGSAENGFIRYNLETNQFEGYGPGNAWGSLGGVVDIAQTTKILASASPSTTDGNLYFYTTGIERMRINSVGNVGIGTTTPTNNLDVIGTGQITTSLTTGALYSTNQTSTNIVGTNVSFGTLTVSGGFSASTANATLWALTATTSVTTSALYSTNQTSTNIVATNITSSNNNFTNISSSTLNLSTGLTTSTLQATNANITTQTVATSIITTSLISLGNSNTIGSLFTTAGNIGINVTSPTYRLDINGNIRCVATSSSLISSNFASNNVLQIQNLSSTGNSVIEFLDQNGNVKLLTGYANQSSNGDGLAASSYIMSTTAVSLNLIAGEQTGCPVILNPTDNSMSITCSTDAVDIYTGALNVAGGVGIANHLYVGDDLHVERDLYVNGAINGAAASSSTFAYMTITATDDAINYSTGSIVTFGGITIQSTANSESVTNGGSFLTAGGASIRKRLFVGEGITTSTLYVPGTSVLNNISSTLLTAGNVITDSINLGVSSMYSGSFTPSNNVTTPSNVTGLAFNNSDIRSFTVNLTASVTRTTGGNLYEYFFLEGNQTDSGWDMLASSSSDVTGMIFTITSSGQIQYTSTDIANYQNSIFRYHVNQIANTGTYSLTTLQTQGTLITNNVQILSTEDSNIGVNNGSLYVAGGVTVNKSLYVANLISTGTIRTTGITAGNINFTGNLYQNGSLYISSQWITNTNGSIFYTSGNVGIGMTDPSFTLDVSGTIRATSGITTNGLNIVNDIDNVIGLNISNDHTGGSARSNINIGAGQIYTMKNGDTSFTFRSITQNTNGISILAAGAADIKFSTANTERARITSNGNFGIGTVSPSTTLHVNGNALISGNVTLGSNVIITGPSLQIPTGNNAARPTGQNGLIRYNTETQQFEGYGPGSAWGSLGGVVDIAQTTKILASGTPSTTDGNLYFYTTGTERMRINSSGNVGVGTTSPSFILDVAGTARMDELYSTSVSGSNLSLSGNLNVAGTLTVVNITTTNLVDTNITAGVARVTTSLVAVGNSNTIGNIFTTGGNVGINTIPDTRFQISGAANTYGQLFIDNDSPTILGMNKGGSAATLTIKAGYGAPGETDNQRSKFQINGWNLDSNIVNSFVFRTGGDTERMRILNNGNVGIGTSTPSTTLDISGGTRISNTLLATFNSNTIGNIFTTAGSVGVGVTAPSYQLHVSGDIAATGDVLSFASISDGRLKQNIQEINDNDAIEVIKSLRPVFFEWKDDIFNTEKRLTKDVGFIAQEIETIVPYAVSEYKYLDESYKNMKHERLIPYLVSSIQHLEKVISEQQSEIDRLKNK